MAISGDTQVVQAHITVPAGITTLVANASSYFGDDSLSGPAGLSCSIGRDGSDHFATSLATADGPSHTATIPLTFRFTGITVGAHTIDVSCQPNTGTPMVGEAGLTVIGTG